MNNSRNKHHNYLHILVKGLDKADADRKAKEQQKQEQEEEANKNK